MEGNRRWMDANEKEQEEGVMEGGDEDREGCVEKGREERRRKR